MHSVLGELWIGDVGWFRFEEIHRIPDPADAIVENFGWPCYESSFVQPEYDQANLPICENLYATPGAVTPPVYAYSHSGSVVPGSCPPAGNATAGRAFYAGGGYPAQYDGALFFADYSRQCVWVMFPGMDGRPDPDQRFPFSIGAGGVVDLEIGPGGDLFYVDIIAGEIRRITFPDGLQEFVRGDGNGDGMLDIGDAVYNLDYLFNDGPTICMDAQDTNDDGGVDIGDPVYSLNYQFTMGAPPPPPFGAPPAGCGADPTPDQTGDLGCIGPIAACP